MISEASGRISSMQQTDGIVLLVVERNGSSRPARPDPRLVGSRRAPGAHLCSTTGTPRAAICQAASDPQGHRDDVHRLPSAVSSWDQIYDRRLGNDDVLGATVLRLYRVYSAFVDV